MAYGVKIKLSVDESASSKQLRSQIQSAVSAATAKSPITIKHFKVELNSQDRTRITNQLQQALNASELTIKIKQIDASDAVQNLRKQLTTMLSGLSITGLKEFLGADGIAETYNKATTAANKLAEAQERVKQRNEETAAAMKVISSLQSQLSSTFKSAMGVKDAAKMQEYVDTYTELTKEIERARNLEGAARAEAIAGCTAKVSALKQEVSVQVELERTIESSGKKIATLQNQLTSARKAITNVQDSGDMQSYIAEYDTLVSRIEEAKTLEGAARAKAVVDLEAEIVALKRKVDVQVASEKAAKRQQQADAAASAKQQSNAKQEENLAKRVIVLRQKIEKWISNNTKAYKANKVAVDELLHSLQNESNVTAIALASVDRQFTEITANANRSGIAGQSFFEKLKAGWSKFGGWSLVTKTMMSAYNIIKKMVGAVIELDAAMTELRKVTDLTETSYARFIVSAVQMSKRIGASLADTINATADFARLGYDVADAASLAEAALVYKNVGDGIEDVSVATESLISTIKAFGELDADDAMAIVDKFNEVGNNFAISSSGIGEALRRSASALSEAGNTLDQSIGLVTAMNSVIQDPDQVGTALKTMTMYLRAAKTEAEAAGIETDGMADSVASLREKMMSLTGIDIMIDDDTFKSTYQIIKEIADVWDDLTDTSRSNVLNMLGGKRNANVISSLIQNFEAAEKAMLAASDAMGSATVENEKYLDSINGKIAIMKATFEEMSSTVLNSNLVKVFIDIATAVLDVVTALSKMHALLPAIASLSFIGDWVVRASRVKDVAKMFDNLRASGSGVEDIIKRLTIETAKFTNKQREQLTTLISQSNAFSTLSAEERANIIAAIGVQTASTAAATGLRGMAAAAKAAWASMSLLSKVSIILTVIELVASGIYAVANAVKQNRQEMIDAADEIISAYAEAEKTAESNKKTLTGLRAEFNELSKGVNDNGENVSLTASEYDRYLSIVDQLIEISPGIVQGYDSERGAIVNYKDALEEAIAYQEDWLENQKLIKLSEGETVIGGATAKIETYRKEMDAWYSTFFSEMTDYNPDVDDWTVRAFGGAKGYDGIFGKGGLLESILGVNSLGGKYDIDGGVGAYYDNLIELYKRRDEVIAYARSAVVDSGKLDDDGDPIFVPLWTPEDIEYLESQLDQIGVIHKKMQAAENEMVDWYELWAQDRGLYSNIPEDAYDEARDAIANIYNPDSLENSKTNIRTYFENLNEAFEDEAVQGMVDMADKLSKGEVSLDDYNAAVANFIETSTLEGDVLHTVISYLQNASKEYVRAKTDAENTSKSVVGLTEAMDALTKGYGVLAQAESEMASDGGISSDTLKSIMDMLADGEKLTDYIYTENGLLKLNTEKWQERSDAMMLNDISALEAQRDELQAVSDALAVLEKHDGSFMPSPDELSEYEAARAVVEAYTGDLEGVDEELANVISTIAIYNAALKGEQEDPLNLTTLFGNLEDVGGQADSLLSALDKVKNGVALTGSEIAQLIAKYPELAERANLFDITTAEGQMALLTDLLGEYELSYDQLIDAQIASIEAQRSELIARGESADAIDNVIQSLIALKGLNLENIYGEDQAESATERYQSLEEAIDAVNTASGLLKDMNSGSNPVDVLQDVLNVVQEYEGIDLDDFIKGFTSEGIDWDESGVTDWVNSVIDNMDGLSDLEVRFPGVTDWLKENAKAAIETAASYDALSNAMSSIASAADILTQIKNGENSMDILNSIIELAEQTGKDMSFFIGGFDGQNVIYNLDNITAAMYESAAGLDELDQKFPGIKEHLIQSAMASDEAVNSYDALSNAIDAVSTASGLLTDIQSGEGDTLDMLQTIADMASQSGQSINDFFTVDNSVFTWNKDAITNWATGIVNKLNEFNDITPETRLALIDMVVAEVEAANAAEQMADAYDDAKSALSGMADMARGAEITYDAYKELMEIDARYAKAVEYQNGVLTLNATRYDNASQAIVEETLAMAEAQALAITLSDEYQELTRNIGTLNDEDQQRLDSLNAEIMGYAVLASELRNATSAYNNFVNASSATESTRYGAAMDAYQVIEDTLHNRDSEIYGKIGREQYKYAVEYLIDPNIEVGSEEFDAAWDKVERYLTEGREGVDNFYRDLVKNGFVDADTNEIVAPIDDVAEKLGISVELVRTMFDEMNEYLEDDDKITSSFDGIGDSLEGSIGVLERYLGEAQSNLRNFYSELVNGGYIDTATNQLTVSVEELAKNMGINVQYAQQMIDNLNAVLSEDMQIAPETDTSGLEDGTTAAEDYSEAVDGASTSAMTAEEKAQALSDQLNTLSEQLSTLNPAIINLNVGSAISNANRVSGALSTIINRLSKIASYGTITVRVNTVETTTKKSSSPLTNLWNSLTGNASASGTSKAKGGRTLVGELGTETVVDPNTNRWYTVGNNGAEFVTLPKNAIVFNADQTRELFETGRIPERGQALVSGNAAASGWLSGLVSKGTGLVNSAISTAKSVLTGEKSLGSVIKDGINAVATGISTTLSAVGNTVNKVVDTAKEVMTGGKGFTPATETTSTGGKKSSTGSKTGSKDDEQTELEKLKEQYEELNKQTEHLIEHQEFLYRQSERGLDYSGMEASLQEQVRLYRQMMADSQKAVQDMIAAGATDTDEELQAMEEAYWSAYDNLYDTLDEINALYVDALSQKVDDIQTAYSNLSQAAQEYNDYGGITVDTFQSLISNGVQYLSLLDNVNGKYVINTNGIQKLIAAEKEQLAVESAISYLNQLKIALEDKNAQAVANLVNLTNQLSASSWDAVYAQAAMLKAMGLSDEEFSRVVANIDALRDISSSVITNITTELEKPADKTADLYKEQQDALDEILSLTEDLIEAEVEDRIEAIEDQIDAYQKIIDLKKESLRASKEEDEYAKNVADKTKSIAELQAKIDLLALDDSREARAQRAQLEAELAERQNELGELQSDHSLEAQEDALDKMAENYEEERQKEIDALENSISSAEKLHQLAIARLNSQWDTLYAELIAWNTEAGSSLNSEITENWLKAAEAVQLYGSYVKAVTGVENAIKEIEDTKDNPVVNTTVATGTPTDVETILPAPEPEPEPSPEPEPEPEPTYKVKIFGGRWNVRTGAGMKYKDIGTVRTGDEFEYGGETVGTWNSIIYNGEKAWVSTKGSKVEEETPTYHTGGIAGNAATIKDKEVLALLEKGEAILDEPKKKGLYKIIDFNQMLAEKLGVKFGTIDSPAPQVSSLFDKVASAAQGGAKSTNIEFNPNIHVEFNHTGEITEQDATRFGKRIATTAIDELYDAFQRRGVNGVLNSKLKQ